MQKGGRSLDVCVEVSRLVPGHLVWQILRGEDGVFIDYIEQHSGAKVTFEPRGARGLPHLRLHGSAEQLREGRAMAHNLLEEVSPDLHALGEDCADEPTPLLPAKEPEGDAPAKPGKLKESWADQEDSGDEEWTTISRKVEPHRVERKGSKKGDGKGRKGDGKGKGYDSYRSPRLKGGPSPRIDDRKWETLRDRPTPESGRGTGPRGSPTRKDSSDLSNHGFGAWADASPTPPGPSRVPRVETSLEAEHGGEMFRALDTALARMEQAAPGGATLAKPGQIRSPPKSPPKSPSAGAKSPGAKSPKAKSPKAKSPTAKSPHHEDGEAWMHGRGTSKGTGRSSREMPEDNGVEQRQRAKDKQAEFLRRQLEIQQQHRRDSADSSAARPVPVDGPGEQEATRESSLLESTRELLKVRKKVREMEALEKLQRNGGTLDAARKRKLELLPETREKLAELEAEEDARLAEERRIEEARLEEERRTEAARFAEEEHEREARELQERETEQLRSESERVQLQARREAEALAAQAAALAGAAKERRSKAVDVDKAAMAAVEAAAEAEEEEEDAEEDAPLVPKAPSAYKSLPERALAHLSKAEVRAYRLAMRKLREIEELEKLKFSLLSSAQKEKRRRKSELLAQVDALLPTKNGVEPAENGVEPAEETPLVPDDVPVSSEDEEPASYVPKRRPQPLLPKKTEPRKRVAKKKEVEEALSPQDVEDRQKARLEKEKQIWGWMYYLPRWLRNWCRNRREAHLAGRGRTTDY